MQIVSLEYINFHWGIIRVHLEYTGVHLCIKTHPVWVVCTCMGCKCHYNNCVYPEVHAENL